MARVLVTGAIGLIGSNVCRLLAEEGDEPVGLVRRNSDRRGARSVPLPMPTRLPPWASVKYSGGLVTNWSDDAAEDAG